MFLLCLLLSYYFVTRWWEDTSARMRGQTPPRHEYRMAKLAARERNGGRAPQSPFNRYLTGLFDDAWDSAHHKRGLMADHRKEKQARKIAAKQERDRQRWARKDAKRGGARFDAQVPTAAETTTAAAGADEPGPQPGRPESAGFYAQVPQPGQRPGGTVDGTDVDLVLDAKHEVEDALQVQAEAERRGVSPHHVYAAREMDGVEPEDVKTAAQLTSDELHVSPYDAAEARRRGVYAKDVALARELSTPDRPVSPLDIAERRRAYNAGGFDELFGSRPAGSPDPNSPAESTGQTPATSEMAAAADLDTKEDTETEDAETPLPNNVIPFKRNHVTTRMELPVTNPEITGLDSAIAYAQGIASQCTHAHDQISAVLPDGGSDAVAASCEQARADLEAGGVTGQALTDVSSVQEQMTSAIAELEAAIAQIEAAAAAANSLSTELESHRTVQEAYAATPDAGSKEFVTAE